MDYAVKCFQENNRARNYLFVVLTCHKPELNGLDQHFQATAHFPLAGSINKFSSEKNLVILGIKPGAAWWESSMLPLCQAAPQETIFYLRASARLEEGPFRPSCCRRRLRSAPPVPSSSWLRPPTWPSGWSRPLCHSEVDRLWPESSTWEIIKKTWTQEIMTGDGEDTTRCNLNCC